MPAGDRVAAYKVNPGALSGTHRRQSHQVSVVKRLDLASDPVRSPVRSFVVAARSGDADQSPAQLIECVWVESVGSKRRRCIEVDAVTVGKIDLMHGILMHGIRSYWCHERSFPKTGEPSEGYTDGRSGGLLAF